MTDDKPGYAATAAALASMTIQTRKTFPMTVSVGEARVVVHADGRIEGDPDAFEAGIREMTDSLLGQSAHALLLPLLLAEMRRQAVKP